ncbi:MAG: nucleoside hydrolase [Tissierellales bacterium]|nr:nucleoside hydrolase [Tissierellales bacterium]
MKGRKVIVDCDPGIDDVLALLLLLRSPEMDVQGITIVGGNVPVELGAKNAQKALEMSGREDIPVYLGDNKPLKRDLVTAQETHGQDGLGENFFEVELKSVKEKSAVEFLVEKFSSEEEVELIALGPLTNIAKSIAQKPKLYEKLNRLVTMGGSFKSHGNCSPVAEYNYWVDPQAANFVYKNIKCPIHMVGLDVTREIVLTPDLREWLNQIDTSLSRFVYDITQFYVDFHWEWEKILGCVINDPLAVAYAINSDFCSGIERFVEIVEDGPAMGQSIVDVEHFYKKESNAKVLTNVDSKAFMKFFMERLFPNEIESLKHLEVI